LDWLAIQEIGLLGLRLRYWAIIIVIIVVVLGLFFMMTRRRSTF